MISYFTFTALFGFFTLILERGIFPWPYLIMMHDFQLV